MHVGLRLVFFGGDSVWASAIRTLTWPCLVLHDLFSVGGVLWSFSTKTRKKEKPIFPDLFRPMGVRPNPRTPYSYDPGPGRKKRPKGPPSQVAFCTTTSSRICRGWGFPRLDCLTAEPCSLGTPFTGFGRVGERRSPSLSAVEGKFARPCLLFNGRLPASSLRASLSSRIVNHHSRCISLSLSLSLSLPPSLSSSSRLTTHRYAHRQTWKLETVLEDT